MCGGPFFCCGLAPEVVFFGSRGVDEFCGALTNEGKKNKLLINMFE